MIPPDSPVIVRERLGGPKRRFLPEQVFQIFEHISEYLSKGHAELVLSIKSQKANWFSSRLDRVTSFQGHSPGDYLLSGSDTTTGLTRVPL